MKVRTTNQMVKFIKKNIKIKDIARVYLTKINYATYQWYCNYNANCNLDYDPKSNQYKVIVIEYKDECYACDKFLTTTDLIDFFKRSDKSATGFINQLTAELGI